MATDKQRREQLKKNIAASKKKTSKILTDRKRSISGIVSEFTSKPSFITSPVTRNGLYTELAKEYKHLDQQMSAVTIDGATKSAKEFWGYAADDVGSAALKGSGAATFGAFSEKYLNDIIGEINPAAVDKSVALNAQIGGMQTNDIRTLRAAVSTTIAEGAVEGLTNPEMSALMQSKIAGKVGQFQFIDSAGRKWGADNYFGMLNQTLHANAARNSYIDTATKEAGFDLYKIEGGVTGSSAENPSDPCDQWAGRIISMTGSTKGFDTYADALNAGVFHPRCVHMLRVVLPSETAALNV